MRRQDGGGEAGNMLPAKPQLSELNALILKLWVPAVLNFLLIPLVSCFQCSLCRPTHSPPRSAV